MKMDGITDARDCSQEDDILDQEDDRLSLAFKNLDHVPVSHLNHSIRTLDLSHNNFSDLSFLKHFPKLSCLILDHNKVHAATRFPTLSSLRVLWLNYNQIERLFPFIQRVRTAFPNLQLLSLMANEAVPLNLDESTFYQHLQYRLFVISWFPALAYLDDQKVTESERSEAHRLYKRPLMERILTMEPVSKVVKSVSSALGLVQSQDQAGGFV